MLSREFRILNRLLFLFCWGGLLMVSTLGCAESGPKMIQVDGKVTYRGKPVPRGSVTFYAEIKKGNESKEVPIGTIEDGNYHVITRITDGLTPGWYQVAVNAAKKNYDDPKKYYFTEWLVPEKYSNPKTSKLEMEVVENAAPGHYDINIEPK